MIRNNTWRFVIVAAIVAWSLYEIYPPTNRDLIQYFEQRAHDRDTNFDDIVATARAMDTNGPEHEFSDLQAAIGNREITNYFPFFEAQNEINPTATILTRLQREAAGRIKLGIDLQGGTSILVEMDTNKLADITTFTNSAGIEETHTNFNEAALQGALNEAIEVLRKRVDKLGVAEPVLQSAGADRILIQLPGLSEEARERAMTNIQRAAYLEFRMVHEDSAELIRNGEVPPGYQLMKMKVPAEGDMPAHIDPYIVRKRPDLTGNAIKNAIPSRDSFGRPEIEFTLNDEGATRFDEITKKNVGHFLAIVLDGELYSAPRIDGEIPFGRGQITGHFTDAEARDLASTLENPLKAPLHILYSSDVDPTLGKDSIRSGIKASIIGVLAVSLFMLCYYLLAGLVANVALVTNIIILLGVMCSLGTTFTLPGIAGIVLTVGMAVDANVLIYERLREEIAKGKSLRGAIAAGYDRAFSTIFDTHVTTLISAVILWKMGTGSVQGFGVTLFWGVAASLFTALVVTRMIFDAGLERGWIKQLKMFHLIRDTKINFMRWALPAFVASWTLIAIGLGYGIHRGSGIYGVEFTGGDSITLGFDQSQNMDVDRLRESVTKTGTGEVLIGFQKDLGTGNRTLRVALRGTQESNPDENRDQRVVQQLETDFPLAHFTVKSVDKVGPTVGTEIRNTAILASVVGMFGILVYVAFRYEFTFAVGAVIAIIHDIFMTLGVYFLAGRELNSTTVAAVLTIIGFSINDTIVIFDRIREDLKLGVRGTFREVINQAVNQTLSRTIITSGTVFLATLSLFIFGGGPVNDFAFTFLVGILTGTYSSIYIASAWVLWRHKGQRPTIGSQVALQSSAAPAGLEQTA